MHDRDHNRSRPEPAPSSRVPSWLRTPPKAAYGLGGLPITAAAGSQDAGHINLGHLLANWPVGGPVGLAVAAVAGSGILYLKLRGKSGEKEAVGEDGFADQKSINAVLTRRALTRKKKRSVLRPSLTHVPARRIDGTELGFSLGKPVHRRGEQLYQPYEEPMATLGVTRSGKTLLLEHHILDAPGCAIATGIKRDLIDDTAELRARYGRVHVFNPQDLGGLGSTLRWDPLTGCRDPHTAMRRAGYLLAGGAGTKGMENRDFWESNSWKVLKSMLWVAAMEGCTLLDVAAWATDAHDDTPLKLYEKHAKYAPPLWAAHLAQFLNAKGKPTTSENIWVTLSGTFNFLSNPEAARMVLSTSGQKSDGLDIDEFIAGRHTLYMIGEDEGHSGVGPLFTALVGSIHDRVKDTASRSPRGRLDPWASYILDECANICSVPLERWVTTVGGLGVGLEAAFQDKSQIEERYGRLAATTIWNNTTKCILGGYQDPQFLRDMVSQVGMKTVTETSSSTSDGPNGPTQSVQTRTTRVPVLEADEISGLDMFRFLYIRRRMRSLLVDYTPATDRADVLQLNKQEKGTVDAYRLAEWNRAAPAADLRIPPKPAHPPVVAAPAAAPAGGRPHPGVDGSAPVQAVPVQRDQLKALFSPVAPVAPATPPTVHPAADDSATPSEFIDPEDEGILPWNSAQNG